MFWVFIFLYLFILFIALAFSEMYVNNLLVKLPDDTVINAPLWMYKLWSVRSATRYPFWHINYDHPDFPWDRKNEIVKLVRTSNFTMVFIFLSPIALILGYILFNSR